MVKKTDLLLDELCPELICGICLDILEDPMQVHCPEDHMFCSKCIKLHMEKQSNCPLCLTDLDKNTFQLSKFVQRQIGRLRVKCIYSENGCPWQGQLSDEHISECKYLPRTCPNADKGCNVNNLNDSNIQQHIESCLYQIITCPNNMPLCQPFLLKDLSKHENECQSYTCPYGHEGCPFMGTLPQVNAHCENYCGKLHQKVDGLEQEVKRLNKLIQEITLGLNIKLPSTPETNMQDEERKGHIDSSMDEMALFHQMFNSDPFGALDLSATTPSADQQGSTSNNDDTNMMDFSTALPNLDFLSQPLPNSTNTIATTNDSMDTTTSNNNTTTPTTNTITSINNDNRNTSNTINNSLGALSENQDNTISDITFNSLFEQASSPQPLQFVPPVNVPKRTSNGKKIRYSKNVRLAHNALRIARQRTATASSTTKNPTNDAILNNLDIAKQKMNNQIAFKSEDDVTQFLNNDNTESVKKALSKPAKNTTKKEKKKSTNSVSSPQHMEASASSPVSANTPKRRPMFILASSYLSNYNSSNEKQV